MTSPEAARPPAGGLLAYSYAYPYAYAYAYGSGSVDVCEYGYEYVCLSRTAVTANHLDACVALIYA